MSYGLLGCHISYSKSPIIHQKAMKEFKIEGDYQIYDVEKKNLECFLKEFIKKGGRGLNVTQPYKKIVAESIGCHLPSVNTLREKNGRWEGFSTDGEGLKRAMGRYLQPPIAYDSIVVIGGGAVFPVLQTLFNHAKIQLLMRNPVKKPGVFVHDLSCELLTEFLKSAQLVIQATSGPFFGHDLSYLLPALDEYQGELIDLTYGKTSSLYLSCKNKGLACMDGYPMLIEQARVSQEIWWGQSSSYNSLYAECQCM
ncbi:MAG: shikimate dehydrogenase [Oligoflexales bacterium]